MRSESIRKEKRMRRNNIIIGSILLFTMVFSMLAVYVSNDSGANSDLTYNGHTFEIEELNGGQMATLLVNGQKYAFYTLPEDTLRAVGNLTGLSVISSAPSVIFTKEPLALGAQAASSEIYYDVMIFDVRAASGKNILSGLSREDEYSDKMVYTCDDASESSPVVKLKSGVFSSINITEVEPYCFELESDSMNILYLRDYVIYKSLGIIQ